MDLLEAEKSGVIIAVKVRDMNHERT